MSERGTSKADVQKLIARTHSTRMSVDYDESKTTITLAAPEVKLGLLGVSRSGKTHYLGSLYQLRDQRFGNLFVDCTKTTKSNPVHAIYQAMEQRSAIHSTAESSEFNLSLRRGIQPNDVCLIKFFDVAGQFFETSTAERDARHRKVESKIRDADVMLIFLHVSPTDTSLEKVVTDLMEQVRRAWADEPDTPRVLVVHFTQLDIHASDLKSVQKYMQSDAVKDVIAMVSRALDQARHVRFNFFPVSSFGLNRTEFFTTRESEPGRGVYMLRRGERLHPFGTNYAFLWGLSQHIRTEAMRFSLDYINILAELDKMMSSIESKGLAASLY